MKREIGQELRIPEDLWWPYRYGLKMRKSLIKFASSYGGKFFRIRRPLAVFISSLLDENHQELHKGTPHYKFIQPVDSVRGVNVR